MHFLHIGFTHVLQKPINIESLWKKQFLLYSVGIRFTGFMNPFNNTYFLLPNYLQFILTVLWVFGVTTVINFSDGLDGLAGGFSVISAMTLFIVAIYHCIQFGLYRFYIKEK